jgi:hypothetical protein
MEGMDLIVLPAEHRLEYYPGHPETGLYSMKKLEGSSLNVEISRP